MRARTINEKFTEDSDAVHDMGIGEAEYQKLVNTYKELDAYMNFDVEDMEFSKVVKTLNYLRRINAYNVAMFFNTKYNFYVKINPENILGGVFAEADLPNTPYKLKFDISGPGNMVGIAFWIKKTDTAATNGTKVIDPGKTWSRTIAKKVEGQGRTIHALDGRFRYYCKLLNIDITQLEK